MQTNILKSGVINFFQEGGEKMVELDEILDSPEEIEEDHEGEDSEINDLENEEEEE